MKYINITQAGGPEVLKLEDRELPPIATDQVLIKVAATGVNRPDVFQRAGFYPPPPGASDIPGLEVAGEVIEVADGVDWPHKGDHVCALVSGVATPNIARRNPVCVCPFLRVLVR